MEGRWLRTMTRPRRTRPTRRGSTRHVDDYAVVSVTNSYAQRRGRQRRSTMNSSTVERKVRELRRLVPGGRELGGGQLLSRTADYIFELRLQVHVLRVLSKLYLPS